MLPGLEALWRRCAAKGEQLTSHTEPLAGDRRFHLLCHRVVGSTFISPLILLAGIDNLKVPGWHDKVIVYRERRGGGTWSQDTLPPSLLEDMQCPEEKVDKWEGKTQHNNTNSTEMAPFGSNIRGRHDAMMEGTEPQVKLACHRHMQQME